jgi:CubicO group peptidase (beta-lactamase class C family)
MKRVIYFFITLLAFNFSILKIRAQDKEQHYSSETEEKIRKVETGLCGWVQLTDSFSHHNLSERMAYYKVNGLSIALIHNYKIEWAKGYGWADTGRKQPVTINTLFQAGAISKSLNALGVLQLADQGKIDLSSDISRYFKTVNFDSTHLNDLKKITIAGLMSHTAGLAVHGFAGFEAEDTIPSIFQDQNPPSQGNDKNDGSRSQSGYAVQVENFGGGITISQEIISSITKEAYDKYELKNVLQPVGMTNSFFTQPPPSNRMTQLATGYRPDGREIQGKFDIYPEMAAAGLWTNPTDLCRFIIELQLAYEGKSKKVISQHMASTMLTPYFDRSDAGLGVLIEKKGGRTYFKHGGATEGFRSQYIGSLENGNGLAIMVNSDNGQIIEEIVNSIARAYSWNDFYKPALKKAVQVPTDTLNSYIGEYKWNDLTVLIKRVGDHLFLFQNGKAGLQLFFTSNENFFFLEFKAEACFIKNELGKSIAIKIHQNRSDFTFLKKES